MNNLIRILTAGLLVITMITPALASGNEAEGNAGLSRTISKQLSLPSALVKPDFNAEVKVDFMINADGSVEVLRVHTTNLQLKDHVLKQFKTMHVGNTNIDTQQVYRIPVKYRVI